MFDVIALGEMLIDFTPMNVGGTAGFQQNAGGAPANVAVAASRLGKRAAFIGKVGDDAFGRFLRQTLVEEAVDVRGMRLTDEYPTTLAFVHLDAQGERSFSFYRNPSADIMLQVSDVELELLNETKVFHFGSVSMTADPSRTATVEAVRFAKEHGAVISFDPNLRLSLWKSPDEAKSRILSALHFADVLKVSEEELVFLTGEDNLEVAIGALRQYANPSVILVTMGPKGCYYASRTTSGLVPSFSVQAVDTTGAGDGFTGAFLSEWLNLDKPLPHLTREEIEQVVRTANACGALTTTRRGGIPALPTRAQVDELLSV